MKFGVNHVRLAIVVAVIAHLAFIYAVPNVLMGVAIERLSAGGFNRWRVADRVGPDARTVVRPSPDFAYAACPYDVGEAPVRIHVAAWEAYWSLSLYAANSDNYYVIDDREARNGVDVIVVRNPRDAPDDATRVAVSPSRRGIALIRRLAPTRPEHERAVQAARSDICAALS